MTQQVSEVELTGLAGATAVVRYPSAYIRAYCFHGAVEIHWEYGSEIVQETDRYIWLRQTGQQIAALESSASSDASEWGKWRKEGKSADRCCLAALDAQLTLNSMAAKAQGVIEAKF